MIWALPTLEATDDHSRLARRRARQLRSDLKLLALFVQVHCRDCHGDVPRAPLELKTHDLAALAGKPVLLCGECRKLLAHALTKRAHCPYNPKPACKHCPSHCYAPRQREGIRDAMRYSGRKLVLSGRLDYLLHLLF